MSNLTYRRGQAEWALWRYFTLGRGGAGDGPASAFKARIKKLLDLDREQAGAPLRVKGRAFSEPGDHAWRHDAAFEPFDVFCLALALDLIDAGFLQAEAVACLRHARTELRREFNWIIKHYPAPTRARRLAKAYPKLPAYMDGRNSIADTQVFIVLAKRAITEALLDRRLSGGPVLLEPRFARGRQALLQTMSLSPSKHSVLVLEFAGAAKLIEAFLEQAPRITRARKT